MIRRRSSLTHARLMSAPSLVQRTPADPALIPLNPGLMAQVRR